MGNFKSFALIILIVIASVGLTMPVSASPLLLSDILQHDLDGDGFFGPTMPIASLVGDCDDGAAGVNISLGEILGDGLDNNCNGQIDEEPPADGSPPPTAFSQDYDILEGDDLLLNAFGSSAGSIADPITDYYWFTQSNLLLFLLSNTETLSISDPLGSGLLSLGSNLIALVVLSDKGLTGYGFATVTISAIPLPAALPLYGTGLAVMGFLGWRRKRKAAA